MNKFFFMTNSAFGTPSAYKQLAIEFGADHLEGSGDYDQETLTQAQDYILSTIGSYRDAYEAYIQRENLEALKEVMQQGSMPERHFRQLIYTVMAYDLQDSSSQLQDIAGYKAIDVLNTIRRDHESTVPGIMAGKSLLVCENSMRHPLSLANQAFNDGRTFNVGDRVRQAIQEGTAIVHSAASNSSLYIFLSAIHENFQTLNDSEVERLTGRVKNIKQRIAECDESQRSTLEEGMKEKDYLKNLVQNGLLQDGTVVIHSAASESTLQALLQAIHGDFQALGDPELEQLVERIKIIQQRIAECDLSQRLVLEEGMKEENYLKNLAQNGSGESVIDSFASVMKGILMGGSIAQHNLDRISKEARRVVYDVTSEVISNVKEIIDERRG